MYNKLPRTRIDLRSAIQTYLYNLVPEYYFPLKYEGKKYYDVVDLSKRIENRIYHFIRSNSDL